MFNNIRLAYPTDSGIVYYNDDGISAVMNRSKEGI